MSQVTGVSFDISKTRTGVCWWRDGEPRMVLSRGFTEHKDLGGLLYAWRDFLLDVFPPSAIAQTMAQGGGHYVVYERAFTRGHAHTRQFYGMVGILHMLARKNDMGIIEVSAMASKKALTSNGRADKASMLACAKKKYPNLPIENHDEADAVAHGIVGWSKWKEDHG